MSETIASRRPLIIGVVVTVAFLAIVTGAVVWALGRSGAPVVDEAATREAFASAMRKAKVEAEYPVGAPIPLESVEPSGEHPFSAEFTAEELSALLAAFAYSAPANGSTVQLGRATVRITGPGTLGIDADVSVDDNVYSASVEGPVSYGFGSVSSPGATSARVEGVPLNETQRAQLTNAVVDYLNAYLSAAPGLRVGSIRITTDGVVVTGAAPDRLAYP